MASALSHSKHALIDQENVEDVITLFLGGIPSGFEAVPSDAALFKIRATSLNPRRGKGRVWVVTLFEDTAGNTTINRTNQKHNNQLHIYNCNYLPIDSTTIAISRL
jgi:hypothetical protein